MKRSYNSLYKSINRQIDNMGDLSESESQSLSDPDHNINSSQSYISSDDNFSSNSTGESTHELNITSEQSLDSETESQSNLDSHQPIEKCFKENLAQLVSAHNVSHNFTDSLLKLLRKEQLDVHSTCRTLLMYNSIKDINIINSYNVEYYFFGLEFMIRSILKKYSLAHVRENNNLKISINIDGLPINKRTSKSMWPILIRIISYDVVFPIAITLGTKPSLDYLSDSVNELVKLCNDGFIYDSIAISVSIVSIICDAPAKSFVKNIIQFNGYFGCDKCIQKGFWYSSESERGGRMTYPLLYCSNRTDESFRSKDNKEHHLNNVISPLEKLPINMINAFSIDYMHCILLGIMKKLLHYWLTSKRCHSYRLSNSQISIINSNINLIIRHIPSCFSRKPRSLNTFRQWKATEFRIFLLYTGKFVLKKVLGNKYYEHFLILSHAVSLIISSRTINPLNICLANKLFIYFIKQGISLYGKSFPVYNVHLLSHLGDDVLRNGALDNFSAFPYENYLGSLKKMIRGGICPLKQVINTILSRIQLGICKKNYQIKY